MNRCRLLVLVLVFGANACKEQDAAPEAAAGGPVRVEVTAVHRGPIADVVEVPGETAASVSLRLTSPVAGRVTFLAALAGDRLAAGQVGARVLPLANEAALHGFALLEGGGESSAVAGLRDRLGRQDIALTTPFAAMVAARPRNQGEQVAPGDVLLELFDPTSLYVLGQVPLDASARVQPGMTVQVSGSGLTATGKILALVPALEPQALTVPVRVGFDAVPDRPLLHAPVRCAITVAQHPEALLVPRTALISPTEDDHGVVMVADQGRAERRAVRLGVVSRDTAEVLSGLTGDEQVLSAGQYGLPDGAAIEPVAAQE
ncbi:MAG: HlyD family efflux transporter periplasmic adaptor subunit [Deltaproteobacteria bacterium]|nr:MAG: HlyD family efflux transporter periplasmic adaptor subunit [Deltaproteobacteria bacterium]